MTDVTITNRAADLVTGGVNDRLTYIYDAETNDVWLNTLSPAGSGAEHPASGYEGKFDGMGGNDAFFAGFGHFTFIDRAGGNDSIVTGDGDDNLIGGAGDDSLYGNGGRDTVDGGAGTDRWQANVSWFSGNVTVNINVVSSFADGAEVRNVEALDLTTGAGNDVITNHASGVGYDVVSTGAGNDRIRIYMGATDQVFGGAGSDVLEVIYAQPTNDVWLNNLTADEGGGYSGTFNGMGGNDLIFTGIERFRFEDRSGGNDSIHTGDGNDTLLGRAGDDTLMGGGGQDRIDGGAGGLDFWQGRLGDATAALKVNLNGTSKTLGGGWVKGIEGMDLETGAGNDALIVHRTANMSDVLSSGAGNDTLTFWDGGTDQANGGTGADLLRYTVEEFGGGVWLEGLTAGRDGYSGRLNGLGSNDLFFTGIERFRYEDRVGGDDILVFGKGNDTVLAGAGNDLVDVGRGRDQANGGDGTDFWTADLHTASKAIRIDLNKVSTYLVSGKVQGFEGMNLQTGRGNDRVTGHDTGAMGDVIDTGRGSDVIALHAGGTDQVNGGAGVDTLILTYAIATNDVWLRNLTATEGGGWSGQFNGMGGNDVNFTGIEKFAFYDLSGGNDIIQTASGRDTISGGLGNDDFTGGGGADRFVYDRLSDEGDDVIRDFTDRVDRIVMSGGSMADVTITAVNDGADTRITLDSGTTILLEDVAAGKIGSADFLFG